jgi:tetratricopeptide (TPR) repeat protein
MKIMPNSIAQEIDYGMKLLIEGKGDEALNFVTDLEKWEGITELEKLECLVLKSRIYNVMGLYEEWYKNSQLLIEEGKRLQKPFILASAIPSKMWALFLNGKLPNVIESFRECISELEELLKSASKSKFAYIEGIILSQKAYLNYYEGHFDIAVELFKKLIEREVVPHTLPLHYLRIGDIYLIKGELGEALTYFKEGLALFKGNSYNAKLNTGPTLGQIGEIYYQQNDLENALEYYKKSLKIQEELKQIWGSLGSIYDGLIKIYLTQGNLEQAKRYLELMKTLNEQADYNFNFWYKISTTRLLKSGSRFRDWIEAENILKKLIDTSSNEFIGPIRTGSDPMNTAILEICDFLLKELQLTNNPAILDEIESYIGLLLKNSNLQNSYSLRAETMLLQAKLALINIQLEEARKLLFQAQIVAEDHDLFLLARKISSEHDNLLAQSDLWQDFKSKNAPLSERVRLAEVDEVIDGLKKEREIKPPELDDEHSMLILIMNPGGSPIFSYPFSDEWKFDDDLFGGFLTAFNSISDEIFSEGLDRVKFGSYTVLMESVKNFLICYLFNGQTYPAKQKLSLFIERIQNDTTTLMVLDNFDKTSQVAELQDLPFVENLLQDIFQK